jgi:uncharacterized protein (TIGR00299 family) protein
MPPTGEDWKNMVIAYLDCPTGIAGDMCLGALVDAGLPITYLVEQLDRLGIAQEYQIWAETVHHNGQQGTKVHVELQRPLADEQADGVPYVPTFARAGDTTHGNHHPKEAHPADSAFHGSHHHAGDSVHTAGHHGHADQHDHHHHPGTRHLPEITALIQAAGLPPRATAWSLAVFQRLAEAEGAVHGIPSEQVHFHEVGATDAIVDIVGTCLGLDWFNIEALYCSALPTGGGTVWAAHGHLPIPAPAVLKLLELGQVPIYSNGIDRELVTPTGAAIATTLSHEFGSPPKMTLKKVGLGAGGRSLPIPNMVRLWLGDPWNESLQHKRHTHHHRINPLQSQSLHTKQAGSLPEPGEHVQEQTANPDQSDIPPETVAVLSTQIDDLNPQAIGYLFDGLFAAGALDVFTQAIGMKKSRPGVLLTVICYPDRRTACETLLFRETSTLGIRYTLQPRTALDRYTETITMPQGDVRIKIGRDPRNQTILNIQPEYEDCAAIAQQTHQPWRNIYQQALTIWHSQQASQQQSLR